MEETRKVIIEDYIQAYNEFDSVGMTKDLHQEVVFENMTNGEVTMKLEGLAAFRKQAEEALNYFSERQQKVERWEHRGDEVWIKIQYSATAAMDFPNGPKKGDQLELKGESIFTFDGDKIVKIRDRS